MEGMREDSTEPPAGEPADTRADSVVDIGTSAEPPTMAGTLELLLRRLKEKRQEAHRADDLDVSAASRRAVFICRCHVKTASRWTNVYNTACMLRKRN